MRKVLVALFAMIIITFSLIGIAQLSDDSVEIKEENNYSTNITL